MARAARVRRRVDALRYFRWCTPKIHVHPLTGEVVEDEHYCLRIPVQHLSRLFGDGC
jgi:hypothetical protein